MTSCIANSTKSECLSFSGVFFAWTTITAHNYFHMRNNFRMYYFDLSTMSSKEWRISHVLSHHTYPNTIWDYEVYAVEPFFQWLLYQKKTMLQGFMSQIFMPVFWALVFYEQAVKRFDYYSSVFTFIL